MKNVKETSVTIKGFRQATLGVIFEGACVIIQKDIDFNLQQVKVSVI